MASARILWLDNDPQQLASVRAILRQEGHDVSECRFVLDAEEAIARSRYDLVILDVMIPLAEREMSEYPFDVIDDTLSTGLLFYKRMRQRLSDSGTAVLVVTVRIDRSIAKAFFEAGLPEHCFVTRYDVRDTKKFVARIVETLKGTKNDSSSH